MTHPPKSGGCASRKVKIRVGLKPIPYFSDPVLKKVEEEVDKLLNVNRNKPTKGYKERELSSPAGLDIYRSAPAATTTR